MQCLKEGDNSQIPPVPAGTCSCLSNVTGELCDECEPGFLRFNPENDSPCQSMYVCTIVYIKPYKYYAYTCILYKHVYNYYVHV